MFNKFIFDKSSIFILLIQFHLHLISFHQRFPHYLHDIFFQNFQKKHLASARCSVKKFQFLPAYIFNVANIIFLISKYYFRLLQYGITRVDLALYLFYNILFSLSYISFLYSYQYLRIIRNIFSLPTGFIVCSLIG